MDLECVDCREALFYGYPEVSFEFAEMLRKLDIIDTAIEKCLRIDRQQLQYIAVSLSIENIPFHLLETRRNRSEANRWTQSRTGKLRMFDQLV
ncbi:unnamed protein product [Sphagnum jensenii]|uniref:Uncharacterized protein n=1 Tax=Sphagnum jensenii TaxID=128206 RepID=A0ABP1AI79_9BRYO